MAKITILVQSSGILGEDTIVLNERLINKWKIPTNQIVTLCFGSSRSQVKIVPVSTSDGLRASQSLAYRLALHHGAVLRMQYKASSRSLVIGPLIGVMMSRITSGSQEKPFGPSTDFCKELVEASKLQGAFVCFFTIDGIQSNHQIIDGWCFTDRWRKASFPIPDVIYNRLTSRKLENKPSVQHFMKEVKSRYNTTIFNEKYLNKTEVFDALKNDPSLAKCLPESHLFRNYQMLSTMCGKYSVVFLKPITGSLGKGIIRIAKQSDQSFNCHFTELNRTRRQIFTSLPKVFQALTGKMKTLRYQIQQGLRLIQVNGRPVDFRALVQRNERGSWAITSIVARIAGDQHFVSNLARGGSLTTVKTALTTSDLSGTRTQSAYVQLRNNAIDIAKGIENHVKAHFAELGIDLAVDINGKVWLLEVNSKPSKNDNTPLTDGQIRPSVKQLIRYARFLTGL